MPFQQLRCRDLAPGDLMLKVSDDSLISRVISLGQRAARQLNTHIVHAGIMFDRTVVIEAAPSGVSANDLRVQNKGYAYLVYRASNRKLADGAGTFAKILFDVHSRGRNLAYSMAGAVGSLGGPGGQAASRSAMDDTIDDILAGRSHRFFCSQLVVMVYQFTAEQQRPPIPAATLFSMADRTVSPSTLAGRLTGHSMFREAGYVMAGER